MTAVHYTRDTLVHATGRPRGAYPGGGVCLVSLYCTRMHMIRYCVLMWSMVFLFPGSASAQNTSWLDKIGTETSMVLDLLAPTLVALGVAYIAWNGVQLARASKDEERTSIRNSMFWGVVMLTVVVSLWGIVEIVQTMTNVGSSKSVTAPGVRLGN